MNVYTCTFKGVYVGGSAVVVARNQKQAVKMLCEKLENEGISIADEILAEDIKELQTDRVQVVILDNGDY